MKRPTPDDEEKRLTLAEVAQQTVRRRLHSKPGAAVYINSSEDTVDRLIHTGQLPIVKLPIQRTSAGVDPRGASRRVLIDERDLDALIDRNKEVLGSSDIGKTSGRDAALRLLERKPR